MSTPLRLVIWTLALLAIVAAFIVLGRPTPARASADPKDSDMTTARVRVFNKAGELVGPIAMPKVVKTDEEWRAQLTPPQYQIARAKGTEAPYCGTLLDNKKLGVYTCVCCGLPLFSSDSKFNSGTGWPSFFQPISKENVTEQVDRNHFQMATEILCARCDAHLGHVFEDGPRPTGLRFCLNSESLEFTSSDALATLADPAAENPGAAAKPAASAAPTGATRAEAVFAGGCFWCTEAVFEELDGVIDAVSGYAGGAADTANYKAVCTGRTGHAEAVQIIYDPTKIDYITLLKVHFATHDPTSLNRQGNDYGPQYRSAIFYANDAERQAAEAFIRALEESRTFAKPIVTTLEPLTKFYPAETYHQNYVCQNPLDPYVQGAAMPKVDKVRKAFSDKLKETSPLQR